MQTKRKPRPHNRICLYTNDKTKSDIDKLTRLTGQIKSQVVKTAISRYCGEISKDKAPGQSRGNHSTTATVIDLSYRQEKFRLRRWLIDEITKIYPRGGCVNALTLPGTEWLFERDLLLAHPLSFITALESEEDVFDYTLANVPSGRPGHIAYLNMTDASYFSSPIREQPFDLMWLDYMGQFTPSRLEVFENMLRGEHLSYKTLFAVTFLKGRDAKAVPLYRRFGKPENKESGRFNKLRKIAIPKLYEEVAERYGYELEILKVEEYCEKQGGVNKAPMLFFAFLLKRKRSMSPADETTSLPISSTDNQRSFKERNTAPADETTFADPWISAKEAAELLRVSPRAVRRACKQGRYTTRMVKGPGGMAYEILRSSIDAVQVEELKPAPGGKWYTTKEYGALVGLTPRGVQTRINRGIMKHRVEKTGDGYKIYVADAEELKNERRYKRCTR